MKTQETKHTPGPWSAADVTNLDQDGVGIFAKNQGGLSYYIASCRYMGTADPKPALANARLIAAAPDLLEALRCAVSQDPSNWQDIARAAIAKATGE
jgi:hypothetical protein